MTLTIHGIGASRASRRSFPAFAAAATLAADHIAGRSHRFWICLLTLGLTTLLVLATQSKTSLLCWGLGLGMIAGWWALKQGGAAPAPRANAAAKPPRKQSRH